MIQITFNAFSFLREKLQEKNVACANAKIELPDNHTVENLMLKVGLKSEDVAAIFVNGRILPSSTIIKDGDRIALVPPGGVPGHVMGYVGAIE